MTAFIFRRLIHGVITFLGITVVVFLLIHAAPGDPVTLHLGGVTARGAPPALVEALRQDLRLDQPLPAQYLAWLSGVLRLDFGRSFVDRQPVSTRIAGKLPSTLVLNGAAMLLALTIGLPLAVAMSRGRGQLWERITGGGLMVLFAMPNFWVALLLIHLFSVKLGWLPLYGRTSAQFAGLSPSEQFVDFVIHMILPVATLTYAQVAVFARFGRAAILENIDREFIVAARARGLSEGQVMQHVVRNSVVPMISLLSVVVPYLISGSVIVERVFQWDGAGQLYFQAVAARDYPTIMGLTVISSTFTLLVILIADAAYVVADPRIRLGERA